MKKSHRFLVTALLLGAYLLSACTGLVPAQDDSSQGPAGSSQSAEAVFTGTVESQNGTQWLISGQLVDIDGATLVDPNIQVGDIVKVEASVSADGTVIALQIESSNPDDTNSNVNLNDNDGNANDDNSNSNVNENTNSSNDNGNENSNANSNNAMGVNPETYGVVEAITDNSITIDGVTYGLADFTEFKDLIAVGDQVKIEIIVNADGTFTIREIEKSASISNDNSNYNSNGDDQSNGNSNDDDHDDDDSNSNSNDDNHGDDNSNDSNSNDD